MAEERDKCKYCGCENDSPCRGGCYWILMNGKNSICSNRACVEKMTDKDKELARKFGWNMSISPSAKRVAEATAKLDKLAEEFPEFLFMVVSKTATYEDICKGLKELMEGKKDE
jgi:hypothetical protein